MKNVLIFGDSYSTFAGCVPEGYACHYPRLDVLRVEDSWWSAFLKRTNAKLVRNDSWSGSTVFHTGYGQSDCSKTNSFVYRLDCLEKDGFFEKERVDTVLIFGGTNDSWAGSPLGTVQFSDWSEQDLFSVCPAICYMASRLKTLLPAAEIVFLINTDLRAEISDAMKAAAERFGVRYVELREIDKQEGHPTKKGMAEICNQLCEAIE